MYSILLKNKRLTIYLNTLAVGFGVLYEPSYKCIDVHLLAIEFCLYIGGKT